MKRIFNEPTFFSPYYIIYNSSSKYAIELIVQNTYMNMKMSLIYKQLYYAISI